MCTCDLFCHFMQLKRNKHSHNKLETSLKDKINKKEKYMYTHTCACTCIRIRIYTTVLTIILIFTPRINDNSIYLLILFLLSSFLLLFQCSIWFDLLPSCHRKKHFQSFGENSRYVLQVEIFILNGIRILHIIIIKYL